MNNNSLPPLGYPNVYAQKTGPAQHVSSSYPIHVPMQPTSGPSSATPHVDMYPTFQAGLTQPVQHQHTAGPATPAAASAAWNKVVVVDPRFCVPQQTTLVLQEKRGFIKTDNFTITDANGQACFKLDASTLSLHSSRRLLDAASNPIIEMKNKLVSLHGTWVMNNMQGQKLAEIKPAFMSLKPTVKVYLNDGDKEADYIVKGNFLAKKFEIKQVANGREVIIASVAKESRFSSAKAFLMKMVSDADKYFLTIEPGVDAAFVTALTVLCDEIFNDQKGNGSLMGIVGL